MSLDPDADCRVARVFASLEASFNVLRHSLNGLRESMIDFHDALTPPDSAAVEMTDAAIARAKR